MTAAIETDRVRYRPGRGFEIRDLHLRVPHGTVFGFLGPNGAGKTTTIKLLLGLLRADDGTIRLLDHPIPASAPVALDQVGYVPEMPHLYPSLTVERAIDYHACFYSSWDGARANDLKERLMIPAGRRLGALSKGEMRKLMLVLALAQRPQLLVLDEPTDGLDPVTRRDILDVLGDTVKHEATTVFMSSHLVHELEDLCDWIAVMDDGRLVDQHPLEDFRDGIKRVRIIDAASSLDDAPFTVLSRGDRRGDADTGCWVVRGWGRDAVTFCAARGMVIEEVCDVSLEDAFVELLRSFRKKGAPS